MQTHVNDTPLVVWLNIYYIHFGAEVLLVYTQEQNTVVYLLFHDAKLAVYRQLQRE